MTGQIDTHTEDQIVGQKSVWTTAHLLLSVCQRDCFLVVGDPVHSTLLPLLCGGVIVMTTTTRAGPIDPEKSLIYPI